MKSQDYNLELAKLRTKMAAQRTLFVCLVAVKAGIIYAATKHNVIWVMFGILALILLGYQYYEVVDKVNVNKKVDNVLFDYLPLISVIIVLLLAYVVWKNIKKKTTFF